MPDSNVLVATVGRNHEHHLRAANALASRLARGEEMILAGHTLLEAYSTLTRLPPPQRASPNQAYAALFESFVARGTLVAPDGDQYPKMLPGFAESGLGGGRVYDALILHTAELAGVDALLTFNVRDFRTLPSVVRVEEP